ncbi:MAG: ABC transporter permease [Dehalococcoidia bacterium]
MKLRDCIVIAIRALLNNKLRSFLTMLGILIGVGAVVAIVSLGQAQEAEMEGAFAALGSNLIYVMPPDLGAVGVGGVSTLTWEDANAIDRDAPSVAGVAPAAQRYNAQIVAGREQLIGIVAGVTPVYQDINNLSLGEGQFIAEHDDRAKSRVVILGSEMARALFGEMNSVGQRIKIDGRQFEVIGVLETKGVGFGTEDMTGYIPLSTYFSTLAPEQVTSRGHSVQAIAVQASSQDRTESAIEEITAILRERHRILEGEESDFRVISMESVAAIARQIVGLIQWILAAIAAISLLVGGIGIMNIMLVSVTERIREIGLRKAVGAKRRDVLVQFLTEAATLSFCGGALGVGLAWILVQVASAIATGAGFPINVTLSAGVVVMALGIAISIGVVSGLYPAIRAATLDPIESLRHE